MASKRMRESPCRMLAAAAVAVALAVGLSGCALVQGTPQGATRSVETQMPANASAEAQDTRPLTFRSAGQRASHYEKHGKAMGFESAGAYERAAAKVVRSSAALHKTEREDGDDVYYLAASDEIVFVSKAGYIRTYFNPGGKSYFDRQ